MKTLFIILLLITNNVFCLTLKSVMELNKNYYTLYSIQCVTDEHGIPVYSAIMTKHVPHKKPKIVFVAITDAYDGHRLLCALNQVETARSNI